jgi:hypothetical protein
LSALPLDVVTAALLQSAAIGETPRLQCEVCWSSYNNMQMLSCWFFILSFLLPEL